MTNPSSDPNVSQKPWEVKLHTFHRTQKGVVVSFVIHPQEVPRALALDDLGTRYGMALARIEEDGAADAPRKPVSTPAPDKPRRVFRDMPRSQQAAIMCQDAGFQAHINAGNREQAARRLRYSLGIESRADLDKDMEAAEKWDRLYAQFQQETGRMAEVR